MYPVDLHMHTVASTHAYSTLHDYINQAKKVGITLLAITDHGPDMADAPHYWHFMNRCVWPRSVEGVAILRGIEANIKNPQGEIDCRGIMLEQMDIVVAGFHEPVMLPVDKETHTTAMIAAMAQGDVDIISHPGNPKYPIDIKQVAEAAAHYNVALEINNSSFIHSRTGSEKNCFAIAQAVKEAGGYLSLGSDSHIAYTLGNFTHCMRVLDAVDFPQQRILNVSPRRLLDFLVQRGKRPIPELADW